MNTDSGKIFDANFTNYHELNLIRDNLRNSRQPGFYPCLSVSIRG